MIERNLVEDNADGYLSLFENYDKLYGIERAFTHWIWYDRNHRINRVECDILGSDDIIVMPYKPDTIKTKYDVLDALYDMFNTYDLNEFIEQYRKDGIMIIRHCYINKTTGALLFYCYIPLDNEHTNNVRFYYHCDTKTFERI